MGATGRRTLRLASKETNATPGPMPEAWLDSVLDHFDQGTQRAILRLYRSAPSEVLAATGARLRPPADARAGRVGHARSLHTRRASRRPTPTRWQTRELIELADAGHVPWLDRPDVIEQGGGLPERRPGMSTGVSARPAPAIALKRREQARRIARVPAWTITAALGRGLSDPRAAQRRSRGGHLSQRTVRASRLHAVGQRLVRRAPSPRLQRVRARARLADGPRRARGAVDDARRGAVRSADRGTLPGAGGAHRRDLVRVRRRRRAARPAACRSTSASLSVSARCSPPSAAGARSRWCSRSSARSQARWPAPSSRSATLAWAIGGHFASAAQRPVGRPFVGRVQARHGPPSAGIVYRRWPPVAMTFAALAPIAALELAFPEGGSQPFVPSAFYPGLRGRARARGR